MSNQISQEARIEQAKKILITDSDGILIFLLKKEAEAVKNNIQIYYERIKLERENLEEIEHYLELLE